MMMSLAFPNGDVIDVKIKKVPAPTMEQCVAFVETQKTEALLAEDGTIIYTYLTCGREI
jgi:hypothetical protein